MQRRVQLLATSVEPDNENYVAIFTGLWDRLAPGVSREGGTVIRLNPCVGWGSHCLLCALDLFQQVFFYALLDSCAPHDVCDDIVTVVWHCWWLVMRALLNDLLRFCQVLYDFFVRGI